MCARCPHACVACAWCPQRPRTCTVPQGAQCRTAMLLEVTPHLPTWCLTLGGAHVDYITHEKWGSFGDSSLTV